MDTFSGSDTFNGVRCGYKFKDNSRKELVDKNGKPPLDTKGNPLVNHSNLRCEDIRYRLARRAADPKQEAAWNFAKWFSSKTLTGSR